jgi:hypothetical protein
LGASQWKEKCKSDHKLKRGAHYHTSEGTDHDASNRDQEDDDDGYPDQDDPDRQSQRDLPDRQNLNPPENGKNDARDSGEFYYCHDSNYMDGQ